MADSEKTKSGPPESPTTARELDFDDEDVSTSPKPPNVDMKSETTGAAPERAPDVPATTPDAPAGSPPDAQTKPPSQPPWPQDPREQAEHTLREAFPTIDVAVIKAVLVASGGQVEPAFNALLSMSDPESQREAAPPPQPPRPAAPPKNPSARSQLEADELYARQLAEHYQNQAARQGMRDSSRDYRARDPSMDRPRREMGLKANELYDDREHSFIDDDLPVIRENIRKGFLETQTKVNSFLNNLKKKIDGEDEDEFPPAQPPRPGAQGYGMRRSSEGPRRSADRDRYDADPQILPDDFAAIHMHDETEPQRKSPRPQAHPDLFKPTPHPPPPEKKVSFSGVRSDSRDNLHQGTSDTDARPPSANAKSKWQPLSSVAPNPVGEHDPFSLGDSDEEDAKRVETKENNPAQGGEANKPIKLQEDVEDSPAPESKATETKPMQ